MKGNVQHIKPGDRIDLVLKNAKVTEVTRGPGGWMNLRVAHAACYLPPAAYFGVGDQGVVINDETAQVVRLVRATEPLPTEPYSVIVDDRGEAYHLSDHGYWVNDSGDGYTPDQITKSIDYRIIYNHGKDKQ